MCCANKYKMDAHKRRDTDARSYIHKQMRFDEFARYIHLTRIDLHN